MGFRLTSKGLGFRILFIAIPLILSAYTHLWNISGFPSIHIDESHYLRRAMLVINGLGPQESASGGYPRTYDHPYFGQLFLGGILKLIDYPSAYFTGISVSSIEMLYFVPRLFMGVLAILDTFIIYKIVETRYNRRIAFIGATFFAVMPFTWVLRRVYLENLLMPLLLTSILLAIYSKKTSPRLHVNKNIVILLSGILLGLAIYTKIPSFTFIPLIGSIVYFNSRNKRALITWMLPVLLIPLIWPLYSITIGQEDLWVHWVFWQTERDKPLLGALYSFFQVDPLIFFVGAAGLVFVTLKKDYFLLGWVGPFLIFSYMIGWVQYFHLILIFPALCIALAILIESANCILIKKKLRLVAPLVTICFLGFGLVTSTILMIPNVTSVYYQVYANISTYLPTGNNEVTLIGSHWWDWNSYWITQLILKKKHAVVDPLFDPDFRTPVNTNKVFFIDDNNFKQAISNRIRGANVENIRNLYENSKILSVFTDNVTSSDNTMYPFNIYNIMIQGENRPQGKITLRANY